MERFSIWEIRIDDFNWRKIEQILNMIWSFCDKFLPVLETIPFNSDFHVYFLP